MANYNLPVVPPWVPPTQAIDRASASTLNNQAGSMSERTLTVAGLNSVIPVVYGEDRLAGVYIARPIVDVNGGLCMAIAWSDAAPYGIEGVQQLYVDAVLTTHQGSGNAQVYIAHYNGLQTTVDPMLSARYTGFTDTFNGVAYSAIRIPARTTGGFPNIEAVVRGRKVLDTRTNTVGFYANPALCLNDFYTHQYGGDVIGEEAVADRCDELVSGQPRCRIGLTIRTAAQIDTHIETLAAYAECLWGYRGEALLLVPDAPVTAPALVLEEKDIREGSWEPSGADRTQIPTSVTITYILPTITGDPWEEKDARSELAGVTDGTIDDIGSTVSMPGIHRGNEAARKALMRLRRLQITGRVAFQMHDNGIQVEVGDVIELPANFRGMGSRWIRVLSNQMVGLGLYQITGELYSASVYEDTAPIVTGILPVGAIIPVATGAVPAGFVRFTAADGRYIKGWTTNGVTGGTTSWTVTAVTTMAGMHSGTAFAGPAATGGGGGGTAASNSAGLPDTLGHNHTFSISLNISNSADKPPSRDVIWIKNVSETQIPTNCAVLAAGELLSNTMQPISWAGRIISSAATASDYGATFPRNYSGAVTSYAGQHQHSNLNFTGKPGVSFYQRISTPAGGHVHGVSGQFFLEVKGTNLAFYQAMVTSDVVPGTIVGWETSSGAIPSGWRLCDGTGGSPNLVDRFIFSSNPSSAGTSTGTVNRLTINGTMTQAGAHRHDTTGGLNFEDTGSYLHRSEEGLHSHAFSTITPAVAELPYYTLMFIEYTGT